jgi:hypothetical protein
MAKNISLPITVVMWAIESVCAAFSRASVCEHTQLRIAVKKVGIDSPLGLVACQLCAPLQHVATHEIVEPPGIVQLSDLSFIGVVLVSK